MSVFSSMEEMYVTKRNGGNEIVSFDKILTRIKRIGKEANLKINYTSLAMKVIDQLYNGITTTQIDELTAQQCASMASTHPDYNTMAGRIVVSNQHKNTSSSFSDTMKELYNSHDIHGEPMPIISNKVYETVCNHEDFLNGLCDYNRDYLIDYFGMRTLERAYLLRKNKKILERPQHMWLRVSIGIHGDNLVKVRETYDLMSLKYFTHATPTLFNSGTPRQQMSSCFLLQMEDDSIDGIYGTLKDCALISKWAGGIGLHIHNVRASGSYIRGTGGVSNGIVPMLRVFNNTAKYVDQCVLPDTQLLQETGGWIHISEIAEGTKIANMKMGDPKGFSNENYLRVNDTKMDNGEDICAHDSPTIYSNEYNYDTIRKVVRHHYSGNIIRINFTDTMRSSLSLTPEHPVLVMKHYSTNEDESGFEWKLAKDITNIDVILCSPEQLIQVAFVEETAYEGEVYDLEMETYPNYFTSGGLVHNGGGKRNGSFAIYLEPWHADIEVFLQMRKNHGDEELKARDLFYALWIPDLFMERVKKNEPWTLMCPDECPGLSDVYGEEFNKLYSSYESQGRGKRTIQARDLWLKVLDAQMETGTPYLCYKDAANEKSNQKNVGIIKSSNLCVAEDTRILTDLGEIQISTLCDQDVNVWNGEEWSEVTVRKTGENQMLMTVLLRRSEEDPEVRLLKCTPYHKFYVKDNTGEGDVREVNAIDLSLGLNLISLTCPDELLNGDKYGHLSYETLTVCGLYNFGEVGDTYCFSEPKRHMGVFNGILTGQCTEIMEVSTPEESAVCNLASIALPAFVNMETKTIDHDKLHEIARVITYNLNQIIDVNFYPTEKTSLSNMRHRPIGIGIQGLADIFMMLDLPFASDEAKRINKEVFETIYHGALVESCVLAQERGEYSSFAGSPASKGVLQFDMWNVVPDSDRYNWNELKQEIITHGLRNSLLLAPMPTASTSQILGYNECIEPITSNIYSRRTLAGEFIMANKYLMADLLKLNMWNEDIKNNIIANNGSVQHIEIIPKEIRDKYLTVWEIPMRHLIDMAADRGAYVCQSQSLNLWLEDPNYSTLTSMHFYAWGKGLKTGIYYLRRRAKHQAQQFTIEPEKKNGGNSEEHDICEMCSA